MRKVLFHETAYRNSIMYRGVFDKFLEAKEMTTEDIENDMQVIREKNNEKKYQRSSFYAFRNVLTDWLIYSGRIAFSKERKLYYIQMDMVNDSQDLASH